MLPAYSAVDKLQGDASGGIAMTSEIRSFGGTPFRAVLVLHFAEQMVSSHPISAEESLGAASLSPVWCCDLLKRQEYYDTHKRAVDSRNKEGACQIGDTGIVARKNFKNMNSYFISITWFLK